MLGFFCCIYIYDVFANLNNLPNKIHQKVERNKVVRRPRRKEKKNYIFFKSFLFVWPNLRDTNNKSCFCVFLSFPPYRFLSTVTRPHAVANPGR